MAFPNPSSPRSSSTEASQPLSQNNNWDELARTFNTAMIGSCIQEEENGDFSSAMQQLFSSTEFRAILAAMRQFAQQEGLSEKESAERLIATFRKLDTLWKQYVLLEGISKIKSQGTSL